MWTCMNQNTSVSCHISFIQTTEWTDFHYKQLNLKRQSTGFEIVLPLYKATLKNVWIVYLPNLLKCFYRIFFEIPESMEENCSKFPAVIQFSPSPVHRPGSPARHSGCYESHPAALQSLPAVTSFCLHPDAMPLYPILQVLKVSTVPYIKTQTLNQQSRFLFFQGLINWDI